MHPAKRAGDRTHPCGTPCVGAKEGGKRPGRMRVISLCHVATTASATTGWRFLQKWEASNDKSSVS
eukprot:2192879-Prorocentrum_lima.AAC.1